MELREALRAARTHRFRSARVFAEQAGLSHSTVAKIENVKRKKTVKYDPGVVVVSKYLRPLGYSLSEFLLQIERQTEGDSTAPRQRDTTQPSIQEQSAEPREAAHVSTPGIRSSDPALVRELFIDLADVLTEAAK